MGYRRNYQSPVLVSTAGFPPVLIICTMIGRYCTVYTLVQVITLVENYAHIYLKSLLF